MRKFLTLLVCLFLALSQLMAQTRTVTGKITDEKGVGISGATVHIKGTAISTTTNADGSYSISVPEKGKALIATYVGYSALELPINGKSSVVFSLKRSVEDLAEVVVQVPYGTVKKTSFTGSEGTVNAATISKQQVTSVTRMIEGQIPGVIATNGGGTPGGGASILIRGIGSVNASSSPLYVVNGVPYDGSISMISTDDIESLTVLKDAAAISLFGSRAANGVVMITTKKGRKGRASVVASMRQGYSSRAIPEYNRVNPQQYYELFWEAYRNSYYYASGQTMATAGVSASNVLTSSNGLVYNAYNVSGTTLVDPTTGKLNSSAKLLWNESWSDALFRTAGRTNPTISISGADDKTDYFVSANFLDEQGTAKFSDYKRYGLRANLNTQATPWLKTGANIDMSNDDRTGLFATGSATSNPFYYSRYMGPIYPVYQHNLTTGAIVTDSTTGQAVLDYGTPAQMGTRPYAANSNLVGTLALDVNEQKRWMGNINSYAEVRFLNDFTFKTTLAYNAMQINTIAYQNNQYGDAQNVKGRSTITNNLQTSLTANEVLNWGRNFGSHSVHALAGHENYKYHIENFSATKTGFSYPGQTALDDASTVESPPSSDAQDLRIESYFAGANYGFNEKYFASASIRRDGSSRFASFARWGTFYSFGLGWTISREKFLSNVSWLNNLKLRGSYGETGNDNIGLYYQYIAYYYADGLGNFSPPTGLANANLQWESNVASSVAADFTVFKKLTGTVELYQRKSKNLLFNVPLAPQTGLSGGVWQNIGQSKNTGIEVQLGYAAITKKNFDWRIDFNISSFKNTITQLPPTQKITGIVSGNKKLTEGGSIYDFYLKQFVGVDPATGLALYYMDITDPVTKLVTGKTLTSDISKATLYKNGSAIPKFQGGLTNSFRYKDFDLSILLVYSYGGLYYDANYAGLMSMGSAGTAWSTDILKRWQKPGDVTNVPRVQTAAGQDGASSRFLLDASYANLKNITLGYQLNSGISRKVHVNDLRIFTSVDNAYILTAKKGGDPQQSFGGSPGSAYPPYRTFTFGITFKL